MKLLRPFFLFISLVFGGRLAASAQVFDWARLLRVTNGAAYIRPVGVASVTDRLGNTYAALTFHDSLRVGSQLLREANGTGAVVKYTAAGQVGLGKPTEEPGRGTKRASLRPQQRRYFSVGPTH